MEAFRCLYDTISASSINLEGLELALIDCRLPDYLVAAIKHYLPPFEIVESVINFANEFNLMETHLREIICKTKEERDDLQVKLAKTGDELTVEHEQLTDAVKKVQELERKIAEISSELEEKSLKCAELQRLLNEKEGIIGHQRDAIRRREIDVAMLDCEIADFDTKLADLRSELPGSKEENVRLEKALSELKANFDEQSTRVRDLEQQISKSKEMAELRDELEKSKADNFSIKEALKESRDLKVNIGEQSKELELLRKATSKNKAEMNFVPSKKRKISMKFEDFMGQCEVPCASSFNLSTIEPSDNDRSFADQKEVEQLKDIIQKLANRVNQHEETVKQLEAKVAGR